MQSDIDGPHLPLLLLVDDDPQIRQLLSEVGRREGLIDKYAVSPGVG